MDTVAASPDRRTRAAERRYLVSHDKAGEVLAWIRQELEPDPHGSGEHADAYRVHTLYFDTPEMDVLRRRGSYGRAKYRIRRYGAEDGTFLERKLRTRNMLIKWRSAVPASALSHVAAGAIGDVRQDAGGWFFRRVAARRLQPVCQLAYTRVARVTSSAHGVCRLTVDDGLAWQRAHGLQFSVGAGASLLPESVVVELKYPVAPPREFKAFVEYFALTEVPFSKYRLAMAPASHD